MTVSRTIAITATLAASMMQAQPPARLQLIHAVADLVGLNSPFVVDSIDLYAGVVNNPGDTTWLAAKMNFKFRQATPYLTIPPQKPVVVKVLPGDFADNQHSPSPTPIFSQAPAAVIRSSLDPNTAYVGVIHGQLNLSAPPLYGLQVDFYDNARLTSTAPSQFQVIVYHGANDVGAVDVYLLSLTTDAYEPTVNLPQYDFLPGYVPITQSDLVVLDATPSDRNTFLPQGFLVPHPASLGLLGQTGVVFASGYANTSDPRKAFGLHVALSNGGVVALPTEQVRRLQVVHNAADPALGQVDLHIGGVASSNPIPLDFRTALPTTFEVGPDGANLLIEFTPRGQSSPILATINLPLPPAGQNHIVFAQGVANPANFAANPDGISTAFRLHGITNIKGWAPPTQFIFVPFHGVTDAPAVDLFAGSTPIATAIKYLESDPEVVLPAGTSATVDVRPAGQSTTLASFSLSASQSQGGRGAVIFASGFLNPANNQNGPAFGLFIVYPNGSVEPLSRSSDIIPANTLNFLGVSENPSTTGEWKISIGAATQGEFSYTLTTLSGQVVRTGTYIIPGAGTWVYELKASELPTGVYILRIADQVVRIVRL
ncbi:MAG: DUF4397 domain-containing protein [Bacteroidia bacterium]|nr:DUF4397 domain-containing protein [Bacteroidia bacterium]